MVNGLSISAAGPVHANTGCNTTLLAGDWTWKYAHQGIPVTAPNMGVVGNGFPCSPQPARTWRKAHHKRINPPFADNAGNTHVSGVCSLTPRCTAPGAGGVCAVVNGRAQDAEGSLAQ